MDDTFASNIHQICINVVFFPPPIIYLDGKLQSVLTDIDLFECTVCTCS